MKDPVSQNSTRAPARRWLILLLPGGAHVGLDLVRRADRLVALDRAHALGWASAALLSILCWGALLSAALFGKERLRHIAATLFVIAFALSAAIPALFFARYNVYLALDAQLDADNVGWALIGSLPTNAALAACLLFASIAGAAMILAARRFGPTLRQPRWVTGIAVTIPLLVFFGLPTSYRTVQSTTPDILYFDALGAAITIHIDEALGAEPRRARVGRRHPPALPALQAKPSKRRNVVLIVEEAIRADHACAEPGAPCQLPTRSTHALTPKRVHFTQMRAIASSTAICIATIWSGLPPTAPRDELHAAPLLWELAKAAGYKTGYLTSQHLMFANSRLFVQGMPLDVEVSATHLDPLADVLVGASDEALSHRTATELTSLEEPFFAVVHYSNAHRPRAIDSNYRPYLPTDEGYRVAIDEKQDNYYKNSVAASDRAVASLIQKLKGSPAGDRTVIVYVSDHGESRFEHGQDNDHGQTLYDEEIRVPAWVDAPPETLTEDERAALASYRHTYLFETDLAPTMIDLLGLWDDPNLAPFKAKMPGMSLLRPGRLERAELLTNVSWAWEYGDPNWGIMQGTRKLFATSVDSQYRCFDLAHDPLELHDLGPAACADLQNQADRVFGGLPRDLGYLKRHPTWGGYLHSTP